MTIVIVDSGCNPVLMQKADDAQMAAPLVAQARTTHVWRKRVSMR
jgi:uncharacterized protein GlcG (DUF336 family)